MFVLVLLTIVGSQANVIRDSKNVITVPDNCPTGQAWVNGQCRDVWRYLDASPSNVVTVPANCPEGQQLFNGECRDVWLVNILRFIGRIDQDNNIQTNNVVTVPPNCPSGQEWLNGECRDIWRIDSNVPKNVITVPPNCPSGQEYINGECRDVWIRWDGYGIPGDVNSADSEETANRNVISVPNQCPDGWKPDALGNCRQVLPL